MQFVERRFNWLAAALLALLSAAQAASMLQEVQTWDEGIHLAAGYSYLRTGDYRLNREHPPLLKLLCAAPLLALNPRLPLEDPAWRKADQVGFGVRFLYDNRVPHDTLLYAGRRVTMLLTLALGVVVAWWTRRRFGAAAALFAPFLLALDPNVIAHGRYVTSDLGLAFFVFVAVVTWERFLESGRMRDLALAVPSFSFALLSKYSAVFLVATHFAMAAYAWWQRPQTLRPWKVGAAVLALILGSALLIGVAYGPETLNARGTRLHRVANRDTFAGEVMFRAGRMTGMPAHPYLLGLNAFATHYEEGHSAYLFGRHSEKGWWYYFPAVFALKTPAAVLILAAACLAAAIPMVRRIRWRSLRRIPLAWIAVTLVPAVFFALAMRSRTNLGVRHILPVYPFLYVAIAATLFHPAFAKWRRARLAVVTLAAGLQVYENVRIYPHYLAFFNVFCGGPSRGAEYLVDSNLDWGQDLKKLKRYLDVNARGVNVHFCYFGCARMEAYGLTGLHLVPETKERERVEALDGLVAVSATPLMGVYVGEDAFRWLRERRPVAKVGYSIYVYDLRKRK